MERRTALTLLAGAPLAVVSTQALARTPLPIDPAAPVGGNPKGDVTIVMFFDYNCPYCKRGAPDVDRVVREDGRVRLIYLDWPILTKASVFGALVALAAKRQGKYEAVYQALMALPGGRVSEDQMREAVKASGVDMTRLQRDLDARQGEFAAQIKRTAALADKLGLQGTPSYVIGSGLAGPLDYEGLKNAVAQARARGGK